MGAVEHFECLRVLAGVGERAAIGAEHGVVVWVVDGGLLQHRRRLGALTDAAQGLGVTDRRLGVALIGVVALAVGVGITSPVGIAAGWRRHRVSLGGIARAGGLAACG